MGKNKDKETLKRKTEIPLESLPVQKDEETESPMRDMSVSLESSPEKLKKKHKRKQLSEEQAEDDFSKDQDTEDHQEHDEPKKKKKKKKKEKHEAEGTNDEDIEQTVITEEHTVITEEPPRKKKEKMKDVSETEEFETETEEQIKASQTKKKKKEKTKDVSETEDHETQIEDQSEASQTKKKKKEKTKDASETEDHETQSEDQSEASPTKKKKKKKKFKVSEEDIAEKSQEEDNTSVAEESETQGCEKTVKKKKATMSKEDVIDKRQEEEGVNTAEESETKGSEKKVKKKKAKASKENVTEKRQEVEDVNTAEESETQSSKEQPKKKKAKMSKESITEKRQEVEDVSTAEESERQGSKEQPKKRKRKLKDKDQSVLESQETQTSPKRVIKNETEEAPVARKSESAAIDSSLLNELKEFIPDVESKEPVNVSKMIKYDLPRFKEFKKQGISLNLGRFTAQENERLKKNVEDFMALTAVDSATKLFFTCRYKQDQESIKKLKGTHKFFERIAEGIPRSCYYVYARGRRMFDDQNYQGEFTKEELHKLSKLHTLHGNNWKKISELMGRSALALQKRYKQLANKEGAWSKKEVQRLLKAVRNHIVSQIPGGANNNRSIRVLKETLYKRLPWQRIAVNVKTRSWSQCREKWMGILAVKMSSGTVCTEKKSLDIQVKLIKGMYEMDVDDAAHVNWEDLTALIGDVPPAYMQRKWHKMKVCYVPEWQKKSFADVIDFLHEKILPQLEQKQMACKDLDDTQHKENEESYLLSDIFKDISEGEDVANDEEEEEAEEDHDIEGKKEKEAQ